MFGMRHFDKHCGEHSAGGRHGRWRQGGTASATAAATAWAATT